MPSCPAGITVSNHALIAVSDALHHRRTLVGTRWRKLSAGRQALQLVRNYMYWAMFAGAFGHTYGHWYIWPFVDADHIHPYSEIAKLRGDWRADYLHDEVAEQVRWFRALMESRPFQAGVPAQDAIAAAGDGVSRVQATRANDGAYLMAYTPGGESLTADLAAVSGDAVNSWWYGHADRPVPRPGRGAPRPPRRPRRGVERGARRIGVSRVWTGSREPRRPRRRECSEPIPWTARGRPRSIPRSRVCLRRRTEWPREQGILRWPRRRRVLLSGESQDDVRVDIADQLRGQLDEAVGWIEVCHGEGVRPRAVTTPDPAPGRADRRARAPHQRAALTGRATVRVGGRPAVRVATGWLSGYGGAHIIVHLYDKEA